MRRPRGELRGRVNSLDALGEACGLRRDVVQLTIQLCTYRRPQLLERVLEACFEQSVAPEAYEIVLVNDGSPDETPAVIERMRPLARCRFTVIHQENAGLANARNAGLERALGARVAFIDDDVLPTPTFVAEHLRSDAQHGDVIVRGAVINTARFDRLPPPIWSPRHYSGNFFWTSNVSVRRTRLARTGGFDAAFAEYGWEDIELGMRLRAIGTRAIFNRLAVAFHLKPPPAGVNVDGRLRQVRAQARTALQLQRKHPHWRVALATGTTPAQRALGSALRRSALAARIEPALRRSPLNDELGPLSRIGLEIVAADAYYDELTRTRAS